jgi:3-hydroxypropanoate dehydrogenase
MSGFDNDKVDELFLANTTHRSNLLCCLGYGDPFTVSDRLPRFEFDEVCSFA